MPSPPSPPPHLEPVTDEPLVFRNAVASLDRVRLRPEAVVREAPAPTRLAPHTHARTIDLGEHATGRLVYLHDPAGQPAWAGHDRLVAFARVEIEPAMAADPMLADVVWAWLTDAIEAHGAAHQALGGTVTTTASYRYGSLAHVAPGHEAELRCSWTPVAVTRRAAARVLGSPKPAPSAAPAGPDLGPHLAALVDALAGMSGLPPEGADIVTLPPG